MNTNIVQCVLADVKWNGFLPNCAVSKTLESLFPGNWALVAATPDTTPEAQVVILVQLGKTESESGAR